MKRGVYVLLVGACLFIAALNAANVTETCGDNNGSCSYKGVGGPGSTYVCTNNGDCDCGNAETCQCNDNNGFCNCNKATYCYCSLNNGDCSCGQASTCSCSGNNGDCCHLSSAQMSNGFIKNNGRDISNSNGLCTSASASNGGVIAGAVIGAVVGFAILVV